MLHMNLEKEELYLNPGVYVGRSDVHRWGVFTETDIKQYDVIQESPYCTFDGDQLKKKKSDVLWRYVILMIKLGKLQRRRVCNWFWICFSLQSRRRVR